MSERLMTILSVVAVLLSLAGCSLTVGGEPTQLAFRAPMNVDSAERYHVSLEVRNVDSKPFRDYEAFGGAMEIRDEAGNLVGRIQVATLWPLKPGESAWPASFSARLKAGAYHLVWAAGDHGSVDVDFSIVEHDGHLYLGEESIQASHGQEAIEQGEYGALQQLVDLAKVDLAQRLEVDLEAVAVASVQETEFGDASLGVPEPGKVYAQVLTPGYIIKLSSGGEPYEYHASAERLVFASGEEQAPQGGITIEEVQVTAGDLIQVRGSSTLLEGTCLNTELWADGELQAWWPSDLCVPVQAGGWQQTVPLGQSGAPAALDPSAQYMVRAYQPNGPDVVSVFAFDLAGPPTPAP
ncbi:MAG: hypothetical protein ACK2UC_09545 [Anaerolineae bacterium]